MKLSNLSIEADWSYIIRSYLGITACSEVEGKRSKKPHMNMTIVVAVEEMRQHTGSSPMHPLCYPILRRQGRTTTTRSWPKHNEAKAITMWRPMFVCMLPLMQLFLCRLLIGSDRQEYMQPPPPPPRNGTVIWNCHMGGDPNPKGGGVMRQMRNFFWCICSHSRKACLPIQRQSILRVH